MPRPSRDLSYTLGPRAEKRGAPPGAGPLAAQGRSVHVVGADGSLGRAAAARLAVLAPAKLVLTARDVRVEEAAVKQIMHDAKYSNVSLAQLDLTSFASVTAFADRHKDTKVDCLLACPPASSAPRRALRTEDGWERTLQTHFLSTALLCVLLLPNLVMSSTPDSPSRLVLAAGDRQRQIVSEKTLRGLLASRHILCTLNDGLSSRNIKQRYTLSKFLAVTFLRELSARLPIPAPTTVCIVDPAPRRPRGWLPTALRRRGGQAAAAALVHAALAPDGGVADGGEALANAAGEAFGERIWVETVEVLQRIDPRVKGVLAEYLSSDSDSLSQKTYLQ